MNRFLNFFSKKDTLELKKSETGVWMVKREFSVLFIGSKEKCESYMANIKAA